MANPFCENCNSPLPQWDDNFEELDKNSPYTCQTCGSTYMRDVVVWRWFSLLVLIPFACLVLAGWASLYYMLISIAEIQNPPWGLFAVITVLFILTYLGSTGFARVLRDVVSPRLRYIVLDPKKYPNQNDILDKQE